MEYKVSRILDHFFTIEISNQLTLWSLYFVVGEGAPACTGYKKNLPFRLSIEHMKRRVGERGERWKCKFYEW
jgi:hypothetical protein